MRLSGTACGVITAAFCTVSIAYAIRYGYGMLLPGMLAELEMDKTGAGVISAAYFFAYTLCSPFLGFLSDKYSPRLLLTVFPFLLALGAYLMAYATTVLQASIVFALAGIGHAACWAPVVSLVQQWVSDRHRGTALAIATMGSGIGIAGWSLWLPLVVAESGYRSGWQQMGIFGFIVVLLNFFLMKRPVGAAEEKSAVPKKSLPVSYWALLSSPNLWLVGLSYACIGFTVLVPFTFLNVYATEELRLGYGPATRFFTVIALTGLVGKMFLGVLSDHIGRIKVMMICGSFLGLGCFGIVFFEWQGAKYLSAAMVGMGFGAVWPVYAAAAIDFFDRSQAGSVIGLWTVFLGGGSMLSPVLCGLSIDLTGSYSAAFYMGFASAILSFSLLVSLLGSKPAGR